MDSMREIKRRKLSIQSTGQITKAMKLVSTAKLQKAKIVAEMTRPYFLTMHATLAAILKTSKNLTHPVLTEKEGNKKAFIVMTSNRGLAGGYNGNVCKLVIAQEHRDENVIIGVGRKGSDYLKKKDFKIFKEYNHVMDDPSYQEVGKIGDEVLELFKNGEISEVLIAYTAFNSSISQEAKLLKLLPLSSKDFEEEITSAPMNYEPDPESVLDYIIPKYVHSILYGALKESIASEHGARMTAMDSATNNAVDMIADLELEYNRARQASITQELSEIVGGAEALK